MESTTVDLLILDTELKSYATLDFYESLIWVDRYSDVGDFEIYTSANQKLRNILQTDFYVWRPDSEHIMIIEGLEIRSDIEDGDKLITTGRSLESILDRRIVWQQTILSGNLQNGIKKLLDENVISPSIPGRTIPNFVFQESTDPRITALTLGAQFTGDNLLEAIKNICDANGLGFKVTLSDSNQFVFSLYMGENRSYDQLKNPYVAFASNFDNIIYSNYSEYKQGLKNITLVAGEGEGTARITTVVSNDDNLSGMNRREMYTDARNLSTNNGAVGPIAYLAQLTQCGSEDLAKNKFDKSFSGEVDVSRLFKYQEDFHMGDIVQVTDEYQTEAKARIVEYVRSNDKNELKDYPTFQILD